MLIGVARACVEGPGFRDLVLTASGLLLVVLATQGGFGSPDSGFRARLVSQSHIGDSALGSKLVA